MKAVAAVRPVSVAMDASQYSFQFYEKGIYYGPKCRNKHLNHGVLVVGYGFEEAESDNNKYWLVKNSWDTSWGMDGYWKMAGDRDNHGGIAIVASCPFREMLVIKRDLIETKCPEEEFYLKTDPTLLCGIKHLNNDNPSCDLNSVIFYTVKMVPLLLLLLATALLD